MKNPSEVGDLLAGQLATYANKPDVIVLALLRSGVPLGATVAAKLNAPLDVFLVRELGRPNQPSLPMGTIATGGVCILHRDIIDFLQIDDAAVEEVTTRERDELARQEDYYRQGHPGEEIRGKTVILVTDSITTGGTAEAAIAALRQLGAKWIVIAAPTVARPEYNRLRAIADAVAAVMVPEEFYGVRQWHHDFSGTTEAEVRELLAETNHWLTEAAA
jgi:putative phosphoribosyl transferase